ncbi:MAG: alcohol dehydrogenase catalytic domain-containing protein [Actinobacteria bacterium]|nr:alcohol dehydrogenase catalytic domain-containing protein [Actinomycetota bacterium]
MKAAVWKKKKVLELEDVPEQEVGPEDVKIKVEYTSICGSDPHIVDGKLPVSYPPRIMGHEMSGTIVELGERANTKGFKVGDRVTGNPVRYCGVCDYCRNGLEHYCLKLAEYFPPGTMAESVVWHEQQVFKLPDSISFEEGCLTEPVSVCLRGIELSDIKEGSSVAILGLGGIGQILLQLAQLSGASQVMVADPVESKRKIALEMGADLALDPLVEDMWATTMKVTGNRGFDTVIEASGNTDSAKTAIDMVGKVGTMVYFAVYPMNLELPIKPFDLYSRELTVRGVFMSPYLFPRSIAILPKLKLRPLVSKIYPLDEVVEAFEEQKRGQNIKILIKCSEG